MFLIICKNCNTITEADKWEIVLPKIEKIEEVESKCPNCGISIKSNIKNMINSKSLKFVDLMGNEIDKKLLV